jgi:glycerol-3-phosphate acyltransferase PlsY
VWWQFLVCIAVGYLVGSIPIGLVIGRVVQGIDIREFGSGKIGFTNVVRTVSTGWGVVALLGDIAKGAAPVVLARLISDEPYVAMAAGLAVAIGHDWPVFAGFRGGRGVSASFGVVLALNPIAGLALLPVGLAIIGITRIVSLMSVVMAPAIAVVFVILAALDLHPWAYAVYAIVAAVLVLGLHKENIDRLLAGTEPKFGQGGEQREEASAP